MASEQNLPSPLRAGSQRAQVYNDGLVVYLYDLSFRESLKSENAWEKLNDAFEAEKPDKALKQFLISKRVAAYELQQDDEVLVDVVAGPPMTPAELKSRKGVKWHKAQMTLLNLPTGQLRVESANSCQIGAEDINEEGATLTVPPGEYVVSLHRINWDEMDDAQRESPSAVGETVTLTPLAGAKAPKSFSALLRFPEKKSNTRWLGAYTIDGKKFSGQAIFPDFWEFIFLNLDRAAFEKLGLGFGSVLDVEVLGRKFTVAYLGESIQYGIGPLAGYKLLVGKDRMTAALAAEPELSLGTFVKQPEVNHDILCCMRVNAKESIPTGKNGKWMKASATVRPEKLEFVDRADLGRWKQDGQALHATVLLRADRYMSLNLDSRALEALGIKPGDTLLIGAGGVEQRALFTGSPQEMAKAIAARSELTGEAREAYMKLRVKTYSAQGAELEQIYAQLRQMFTGDPPLVACLDKYWLDKEQLIFLITPMAANKESIKLVYTLDFPVKAGDAAVVRKA